VRLHDLDRLTADRSGRPEQRHTLHPLSVGSPRESTSESRTR
jgi:hypothetical protein